MDLSVAPDGNGCYVVSCPSHLEWQVREELLTAVIRASEGVRLAGVIIDLDGVKYISSAGLGAIFSLRKYVLNQGGRVVVARPGASVSRLLRTVNLGALIPVVDAMGEARRLIHDTSQANAG